MITFNATHLSSSNLHLKLDVCPSCGKEYKFYSVSPKKCVHCEKVFPDIMNLFEYGRYRVEYHISKEDTNDE